MKATKNLRRFQSCVILSLALSCVLPGICKGGETCPTNSSGPDICVSFDGDTPELDTDFRVDYTTDASNPSVALKTGNLTWNVRSNDSGSPGNIGTLSLDPTVSSDNFGVSIKNGLSDGAVNVGAIDLDPAGHTGYSSISGSISGNLTGDLDLAKDSGGNGGLIDGLTIFGDVSGNVTCYVVNSFVIHGDLSSVIDINDELSGKLKLLGNSTSAAFVAVVSMSSSATITVAASGKTFGGYLSLGNGIPAGSIVKFNGDITSTATIALGNADLAGTLQVLAANAGDILNGGAVTGSAQLTRLSGNDFSGEATFASVSASGAISVTDLSGTITVTGATNGSVTAYDDVLLGGWINLQGDVKGDVAVGDAVSGTIDVGELFGDVAVAGDVTSSGLVDVNRIMSTGRVLVDGILDGNITVATETKGLSLIHVIGGIGSGATIVINYGQQAFDANGDIHIGSASLFGGPNVEFDGCIKVWDDFTSGSAGDLNGDIDVVDAMRQQTT